MWKTNWGKRSALVKQQRTYCCFKNIINQHKIDNRITHQRRFPLKHESHYDFRQYMKLSIKPLAISRTLGRLPFEHQPTGFF
jgi:hypothetical protein